MREAAICVGDGSEEEEEVVENARARERLINCCGDTQTRRLANVRDDWRAGKIRTLIVRRWTNKKRTKRLQADAKGV